MLFSVIYSCDAPMSERIGRYWPQHRRRWVLTENSNGQPNDWNGEWKCRHRKWCGILTKAEFETFIGALGLDAEDVETMGSLGAPGCGYGLVPAVSFIGGYDAILSAYVTPLPLARTLADLDRGPRRPFDEHDFERIHRAMIHQYA